MCIRDRACTQKVLQLSLILSQQIILLVTLVKEFVFSPVSIILSMERFTQKAFKKHSWNLVWLQIIGMGRTHCFWGLILLKVANCQSFWIIHCIWTTCNMVSPSKCWWNSLCVIVGHRRGTFSTEVLVRHCFDTVGWVTWPVKILSPNDLCCVEWDVKPYSTQLDI